MNYIVQNICCGCTKSCEPDPFFLYIRTGKRVWCNSVTLFVLPEFGDCLLVWTGFNGSLQGASDVLRIFGLAYLC